MSQAGKVVLSGVEGFYGWFYRGYFRAQQLVLRRPPKNQAVIDAARRAGLQYRALSLPTPLPTTTRQDEHATHHQR